MIFDLVQQKIETEGQRLMLISGGCPEGADSFAEKAADYFGVSMLVHYPVKIPKATSKQEATDRFYARNRKIAMDCDILYAMISPDRTGGSENTIKYALSFGKTVVLIFPDGSHHEWTN